MEGCVILKSLIIFVIFYVASTVHGDDQNELIIRRCDQMPHPGECKNLLITRNRTIKNNKPIKTTIQFLKASLQRTLDVAVKAKSDTYSLGVDSKGREKEVWEDCMELYDQTIHRLNQTVLCPKTVCSRSDVQAWLSTALTNLDTCREEMEENGVSSDSLRSMLESISNDVVNALAINKMNMRKKTNLNGFGSMRVSKMAMKTSSRGEKVDVVVAQDGSGDYKAIQEAVDGAGERPKGSPRYVIHVKQGVYNEYVNVGQNSNNIMIIGDGIGKTIITGDKSKGRGFITYKSATFVADGDGFIARDITIRNTAGPENHQAVALRSRADYSVFFRCSIEGYQDTLYVHSGRQFFRQCDIYGTVDFIFGNAAVVFQFCRIFARNSPNKVNAITAQSRVNEYESTGIVIQNSVVKGTVGAKTYLGRPWRPFARTVVMGSFLELVEPEGWIGWGDETAAFETLYYGEFKNWGPGSVTTNRVNWTGFHVISDIKEARQFTPSKFIDAASWLPSTKVAFNLAF